MRCSSKGLEESGVLDLLPGERILRALYFKMEMASGRSVHIPSAPDGRDLVPWPHIISDRNQYVFKVRIPRLGLIGMFNEKHMPISAVPSFAYRFHHQTLRRSNDRRPAHIRDINGVLFVPVSPIIPGRGKRKISGERWKVVPRKRRRPKILPGDHDRFPGPQRRKVGIFVEFSDTLRLDIKKPRDRREVFSPLYFINNSRRRKDRKFLPHLERSSSYARIHRRDRLNGNAKLEGYSRKRASLLYYIGDRLPAARQNAHRPSGVEKHGSILTYVLRLNRGL